MLWKSISDLFQLEMMVKSCDAEHYPKSPYIEHNEKYMLGLVKGHYFINDTITLTSYCLEKYE